MQASLRRERNTARELHFSLATKGDSATPFNAGYLGNGIFRQFKRMIFDPRRRRLILEQ